MSFFIPPRTLVMAMACCSAAALAQPLSTPAPAQKSTGQPARAAQASTLGYTSTFDKYHPFGEATLVPWRQANEAVYKAGGWRAYAKEAQAPSASLSASPPPALPAPPARPAPTASGAKP